MEVDILRTQVLNRGGEKVFNERTENARSCVGAEYFRNLVLGRKFLIVTDHKALVSLLNGDNKKNKTMFSRLTRWLDRLIPFDFQVEHEPRATIGFADNLLRHPSSDDLPVSTFDSMFTVAKISQIRSALRF